MKINQLRCILVVFLLFVICANSIAQNRFSRSYIKKDRKKYGKKYVGDTTFKYFRDPIGDTTRKFKLSIYDMSFELNYLKTRLNEIKVDTNDFEYIPIYTIDINIVKDINDLLLKIRIKNSTYYNRNYKEYTYVNREYAYKQICETGEVDSSFIILSQVLIIKKKNFKIIGSMYFGNDNCFFINNGRYKNGYLKHNRYYKLSTAECYSTEAIDWISEKNNRMISKMLKEHNHQQFLIKINDIQGLFYFLQNGKIQFFELKHASNPSIPVRPQY